MRHRYSFTPLLALLPLALGWAGAAHAQITSVKSGFWNDPTVWSTGAVPTAADDVVIDGDTVDVNITNAAANDVTVQGTAWLRYDRDPDPANGGADPARVGWSLEVMGDLVLASATAEVRPLSNQQEGGGTNYGDVSHRLTVHGDVQNTAGGTFDMVRGSAGSNRASIDLIFEGTGVSDFALGPYDTNLNQLYRVYIRKDGTGRVVLGSNVTSDNTSAATLNLETGLIVTGPHYWRMQTNNSAALVIPTPGTSWVVGTLIRGLPSSGTAYSRVFAVGDERAYRPAIIYSSDVNGGATQDFGVRVVPAPANPGGATLQGGLTDVSPVRYYEFQAYAFRGFDPYVVDRVAIAYGPDDRVPEGSDQFVVATSVDGRNTWRNSGGVDPGSGSANPGTTPHVISFGTVVASTGAPMISSTALADFTFTFTEVGTELVGSTFHAALGATTAPFNPVTAGEEGAAPRAASSVSVYPNPSRARATVRFALAAAGSVRVRVFDVLGREVAVLADGALPAGPHSLTWDAGDLPGGVYVVRLDAGDRSHSRQLTLAR